MRTLLGRLDPLCDGTFLDVGVNLGQTLLAFRSVTPTKPYVGVEPNPLCVAYVQRMIHENDLAQCAVIPVGLGREAGILPLQFFSGRSMDTSASIVPDFRPEQPITHTMFVPVFPYREVERAASIDRLGLVKIDVEGAEADVLASMETSLRAHTPTIVIEILPCYRADNHARLARQQEIEALMASLDYELYRIEKGADDSLQGLARIDEIGVHGDLSRCDYVLHPRARRNALRGACRVRG